MDARLKLVLIVFIAVVVVFFAGYFLAAQIFTSKARNSTDQLEFIKGTIPDPLPNGALKGNADGQGSWLGKTFDVDTQRGINNFKDDKNKKYDQYPFKTYAGLSISDPKLLVLKIDYNLPENPFYIRWVQDELVEVSPGKYLGKANLAMIPGIIFTLTFFRLEVQSSELQ